MIRLPSFKGFGSATLCAAVGLLPLACDPAGGDLGRSQYFPRNAHQAYGYSLAQARLVQTALGGDWLAAAERALDAPVSVSLPFAAVVAVDAAHPEALGYRFEARSGQRVSIVVDVRSDEPLAAFVDLFRIEPGGRLAHVASAPPRVPDSGPGRFEIEWAATADEELVLRAQPELLRGGELTVEIAAAPYLGFPVEGLDTRAIQSGFGAERDGGRRAHRGVDIFAARGTPALAALDAWVTRVETTPRGGNVVWLQTLFGDLRLYYAHLDTQLVTSGEFVAAGDVVGWVGNTGNARTTPPHLHFGVYLRRRGSGGGARDPYDFLK